MEATEEETELASRYLRGEYNEVQFNYMTHQCGSSRDRMEEILEMISFRTPLLNAARFILICMLVHFLFCLAHSFASL